MHFGPEYLMSFYLKVRLLVLLLSYGVHWESPGQRLAQKILARYVLAWGFPVNPVAQKLD